MKLSISFAALLLQFCTSFASPILETRQDYKIRGVNLGGWLVIEPWITPSLFDQFGGIDEYSLSSIGGAEEAIKNHWASFYTQADFQAIASAGLNSVRIPMGYWAFQKLGDDPYIQGQTSYLDRAIDWARATGLKVYIDLHGAPGSQNGFDNSGRRDKIEWQQGNNVGATLDVIQQIAEKYGQDEYLDVVWGIQLLNEPLGPKLDMEGVRQFARDGFGRIRQSSSARILISDAFQPPSSWNEFSGEFDNVIIDHHHYQIFTVDQITRSSGEQIQAACDAKSAVEGTTTSGVIVGEWSAALTDCTKYLNGVGRGARYEGQWDNAPYVGDCGPWQQDYSSWTEEMRNNVAAFTEAQLDTWERYTNGWFYWTWKTEDSPEWDMSRLVANGLFPQPITSRRFNSCA